jgi:NTE family protein
MRALVLSGGGAKGAYECGAIKRLLGEKKINYAIYSGTSVGAINAAHLAQFKSGQERSASDALERLWRDIRTDLVYKKWNFLGELNALWKPSVYTTAPLRSFIKANLNELLVQQSGKHLRLSAVNLIDGVRRVWTEAAASPSGHLLDGIMASAAMPVFFEPVACGGALYVDGGIRETTPIRDAVKLGATDIDVIVLDQKQPEGSFPASPNALDVGKRTLGTMLLEIEQCDLEQAVLHNRLIDAGSGDHGKRKLNIRVLRPKTALGDPLDFSPEKVRREISQGFEEASAAGW